MSSRRVVKSAPGQGASWSKGGPPDRRPTATDWDDAPRLCSLSWAAWLVGMPPTTFRALMTRDVQLCARLSYKAPEHGYRWYFTARVREWVEGPRTPGLHLVKGD